MVEVRGDSLQRAITKIQEVLGIPLDERERMQKALGMLTSHQRLVLSLEFGVEEGINEGQPWDRKRMGDYLGINPKSVASLERRAIRALRTFDPPELTSTLSVLQTGKKIGIAIQKVLEKTRANWPRYPTDPEEEERRRNQLHQNPDYQALTRRYYDPATPEQEKEQLYDQLRSLRWAFMTGSKQEELPS